jgi:hypothetical protein
VRRQQPIPRRVDSRKKATIRRRFEHTHTRADLVKVVVRSALLK